MSLTRQAVCRFLAWLLMNLLFIAATSFFLKPRDITFDAADAFNLLGTLFMGSVFWLVINHYSAKLNDEAFSRRMAASGLLAMTVLVHFEHLDVGGYLGISNPGVSAMLTVWTLVIVINVALQGLHRLSPSTFR